jgi:hypothetical protein
LPPRWQPGNRIRLCTKRQRIKGWQNRPGENHTPDTRKKRGFKMKLFAIKLSIIGADGTPEVVVTALHSASAMDAAIHALGQYPALVSLSVKPVKE